MGKIPLDRLSTPASVSARFRAGAAFRREWYVYILRRVDAEQRITQYKPHLRHYTGHTHMLDDRLNRHNTGQVFTTAGCTWEYHIILEDLTRPEAVILEKWFKDGDTVAKRTHLERWMLGMYPVLCNGHDYLAALRLLPAFGRFWYRLTNTIINGGGLAAHQEENSL